MNRIYQLFSIIGLLVVLILWYFFEVRIIESILILVGVQMILGNVIFPIIRENVNKNCISNNNEIIVLISNQEVEYKSEYANSSHQYFPQGIIPILSLIGVGWIICFVYVFVIEVSDLVLISFLVFLPVFAGVLYSSFRKLSFSITNDEIRFTFVDSFGNSNKKTIKVINITDIKEIKLYKSKILDNNREDSVYEVVLNDGCSWYATFTGFSSKHRNEIRVEFEKMLGIL